MDIRQIVHLLQLLLLVSETFARCRFPRILQSHAGSSWWLYHVTSGGARTTDDTLYYIEFLSEQMIMTPVPGTKSQDHPPQIQKECILKNADRTYIVRSMTGKREYFCLRFVFHSNTVLQLEMSDPFLRADDTKCDDLHKDPWPIVRYDSDQSDYVPCPVIGGFQMTLTDPLGRSLCESYVMSARFESGCEEPKGIILKLDHCKTARTILDMNYRQKLHCLASWHEDNVGLVIITKRDDAAFFWTITLKETSPSVFNGAISSDIVIEPSTRTKHSVGLTLKRVVYRSTCADLSDTCDEIKNGTCAADDLVSMTLCAKLCGQCSTEKTSWCSFRPDIQGSWLGFQGTEMFNLTVDDHHIHAGSIDMRCEERDTLLDTYTLVTFKEDGCYPEYKCLKVRHIFDNVVKYDYERGPSWPVFIKDHLCTPYVTKNDIRHRWQMSLAFKAPPDDVTVCDIPPGTYESEVLFGDGNVCVAIMSKQNCSEGPDVGSVNIDVYFNDCRLEGVFYIQYTCVMQLPTKDESRKKVLVHTNEFPPSYFCLLYDSQFKEMVVLPASKCFDHLNSDIVATYSLKLTSPKCMEGLPLITKPTVLPQTMVMTSEGSFYEAIYDDLNRLDNDYSLPLDKSDRTNSNHSYDFLNSNTTGSTRSSCNFISMKWYYHVVVWVVSTVIMLNVQCPG